MCGSPPSLPRALSCDAGATAPGEVPGGSISRAGSSRLSPHTHLLLSRCPLLPLWPSKHLMSGTLNPSPERRGPDQGTSSAHSGPTFDFYQ